MADHVNVYWSLFQGSFPGQLRVIDVTIKYLFTEEWKNEPEFAQYMTELTSYSIEKLGEEASGDQVP